MVLNKLRNVGVVFIIFVRFWYEGVESWPSHVRTTSLESCSDLFYHKLIELFLVPASVPRQV